MFVEKLNIKQDGVYVIEEEKAIANGIWEGYLDHDNVNHQTIAIYTGPKLTGDRVENYFISTPQETPWKTHLKVFSKSDTVYVTYETPGDQVEAEDINVLQDELVNEINRATLKENRIDGKLDDEIDRSINVDNVLNGKINDEVERSEAVDIDLSNKIASEIERSKDQDQIINTNLISEINRAKDAENKLKQDITNEESRAINKENEITSNLNSYIDNHNIEVQKLKEKDSQLEKDKADKVYVDAELNKKYNKEQVFTKEEVLQKIEDLIGAAPEALDTLAEIADALDNDPNFATNIINLLSTKVDKVEGKQLSTNDFTNSLKAKLDGIEEGANKYIHPSTHSANIILENSSKRFVSDTEKANWNSKETPIGAKDKADNAESNAKLYTDNHANNNVKHITANERSNWDDANSKKHTHSNKSVLDKITQALVDAWNSAVEHIGDSIRHITSAERIKWNAKAEVSDIPTKVGQLENDKQYVTSAELGIAGYGDMTKGVYDKNSDGIVDEADIASSFRMIDTRNVNDAPKDLIARRTFGMFKYRSAVGNPPVGTTASYVFILNVIGWSVTEGSGGWPIQLALGKEGIAYRMGVSNTEWSSWTKIANLNSVPTKLSQLEGPLTCDQLRGKV